MFPFILLSALPFTYWLYIRETIIAVIVGLGLNHTLREPAPPAVLRFLRLATVPYPA